MEALAGPVVVVAALLALAGGLKIIRPAPTAGALRAMRLPAALPLVRLLGIGEVTIGVAAGVTFARPVLVLLAAAYLAFAAFVTAALGANTPLQSCGCFGQADTPPSAVHVGLNLAAAGTAFAAALSDTPGLAVTLPDQPWNAIPFVLLVVICVHLCVLLVTVLPQALGSRPGA
ncbi:MAG: hypothetical protein QOI95_1885 [Acidimicrobiaceae bacterium]|jgi:hypothetical protein